MLRPVRDSSRLSIAVPEKIPDALREKDDSVLESHCSSASRADSMKPIDSTWGVVCALPTTKLPAPSTMNVSVIVPPASIASTRGSGVVRGAIALHYRVDGEHAVCQVGSR